MCEYIFVKRIIFFIITNLLNLNSKFELYLTSYWNFLKGIYTLINLNFTRI